MKSPNDRRLGYRPVLDVDTYSTEVATEEAAVDLLVRQVARRPAPLVIHNNERAALGRSFHGSIDANGDLMSVSGGHLTVFLPNLLRNRPGEVAQVMLLTQTSSPMLTCCEEVISTVVRVARLRSSDGPRFEFLSPWVSTSVGRHASSGSRTASKSGSGTP